MIRTALKEPFARYWGCTRQHRCKTPSANIQTEDICWLPTLAISLAAPHLGIYKKESYWAPWVKKMQVENARPFPHYHWSYTPLLCRLAFASCIENNPIRQDFLKKQTFVFIFLDKRNTICYSLKVSEKWKFWRYKQNARIGERNEGILDGSAIIVDLRGIQSLRRKYPPDLVFECLFSWWRNRSGRRCFAKQKTVPERLTSD